MMLEVHAKYIGDIDKIGDRFSSIFDKLTDIGVLGGGACYDQIRKMEFYLEAQVPIISRIGKKVRARIIEILKDEDIVVTETKYVDGRN